MQNAFSVKRSCHWKWMYQQTHCSNQKAYACDLIWDWFQLSLAPSSIRTPAKKKPSKMCSTSFLVFGPFSRWITLTVVIAVTAWLAVQAIWLLLVSTTVKVEHLLSMWNVMIINNFAFGFASNSGRHLANFNYNVWQVLPMCTPPDKLIMI